MPTVQRAPLLLVPLLLAAAPVAAAPKLEVTPAALDFGTLSGGASSSKMITVRNAGDEKLQLQYATIANNPSSVFSHNVYGQTLSAGASKTFQVTFTARAVGQFAADLSVLSSTAGVTPVIVKLTGACTAPIAAVAPTAIDFGLQPPAMPAPVYRTVTVSNGGTAELSVSQVALSDKATFRLKATLPLKIPAGGKGTFEIGFWGVWGRYHGTAKVMSGGWSTPLGEIALDGEVGNAATDGGLVDLAVADRTGEPPDMAPFVYDMTAIDVARARDLRQGGGDEDGGCRAAGRRTGVRPWLLGLLVGGILLLRRR